jgi:hypothetical protein
MKHPEKPFSAYRCGGSRGIEIEKFRTAFPFHPQKGHQKRGEL